MYAEGIEVARRDTASGNLRAAGLAPRQLFIPVCGHSSKRARRVDQIEIHRVRQRVLRVDRPIVRAQIADEHHVRRIGDVRRPQQQRSITPNIVAFAPMPSANTSTDANAKPRCVLNTRKAKPASWRNASSHVVHRSRDRRRRSTLASSCRDAPTSPYDASARSRACSGENPRATSSATRFSR